MSNNENLSLIKKVNNRIDNLYNEIHYLSNNFTLTDNEIILNKKTYFINNLLPFTNNNLENIDIGNSKNFINNILSMLFIF